MSRLCDVSFLLSSILEFEDFLGHFSPLQLRYVPQPPNGIEVVYQLSEVGS